LINGNLNSTKAHYEEGDSIPYRMVLTGLSAGSHVLVIEWDTKANGKHALDYMTHYARIGGYGGGNVPEVVDPTTDIAGLGAPSTYPIPPPSTTGTPMPGQPATSFLSLPAGERLLTIWNGTITSAAYAAEDSLASSSASSSIAITFTSSGSTAVIAWGGHITSPEDWELGNSASAILGSPYHTRLVSFDGAGGNQDRSLSAEAVIPAASSDLGITRTVDNGAPHIGDQIIYTLTVVNSGPSPATGVVVNDVLPDGTVDITDLSMLAGQYRQVGTGLLADLNCDEVADALVLSMLMTLWRS
jgi:uncharacterized repeat protein (TIGR01451 family)